MNRFVLTVLLGLASFLSLVGSNFRVGGPPFSNVTEPGERYALIDTGENLVVQAMNNRGDFIGRDGQGQNKRWINGEYQNLSHGSSWAMAEDLAEDGAAVGQIQTEPTQHDSGMRAVLWPADSTLPVVLQTAGVNVTNASGSFISHSAAAYTIDGDKVYGFGTHFMAFRGLAVHMAEASLVWDLSESLSTPATTVDTLTFQPSLVYWNGTLTYVDKARGGHSMDIQLRMLPWLHPAPPETGLFFRVNEQDVSYSPLDINKYGAHIGSTSTNGYLGPPFSTFLQQGTNRIPLPRWAKRLNARRETNQTGDTVDFFQVVGQDCMAQPEYPGSSNYVTTHNFGWGYFSDWWILGTHHINDHGMIVATGMDLTLGSWAPRTVVLLPVEIRIKRQGERSAPNGGLVVDRNSVVEIQLTRTPQENFPTPAANIKWYSRKLKWDGTYEAWQDMGPSARGVKFSHTCEEAGIFQVKCEWSVGTLEMVSVFERDHDDPNTTGIEKLKRGDPDSFGVVEAGWQIRLLEAAKAKLGSRQYAQHHDVPPIGPGLPKCNIFVAHCGQSSGVTIPWINGYSLPPIATSYPPVANQWAGVPPNPPNNPEYEELLSLWWQLFTENTHPQPGSVVAKGIFTWGWGHCGIVDYDGQWISASSVSDTVNRQANFANQRGSDLELNEILPRMRGSMED